MMNNGVGKLHEGGVELDFKVVLNETLSSLGEQAQESENTTLQTQQSFFQYWINNNEQFSYGTPEKLRDAIQVNRMSYNDYGNALQIPKSIIIKLILPVLKKKLPSSQYKQFGAKLLLLHKIGYYVFGNNESGKEKIFDITLLQKEYPDFAETIQELINEHYHELYIKIRKNELLINDIDTTSQQYFDTVANVIKNIIENFNESEQSILMHYYTDGGDEEVTDITKNKIIVHKTYLQSGEEEIWFENITKSSLLSLLNKSHN